MSLEDKAKELGQEIRETEEYQELERAGDNLKSDPTAQELIQAVQEAQKTLEFSQQSGVQPGEEQVTNFNNLREQMHSNLTVRSFMKAQEDFNNVMKTVNDAISYGITGEKNVEGEK